jgi:vancomycin resistance protein YoaR
MEKSMKVSAAFLIACLIFCFFAQPQLNKKAQAFADCFIIHADNRDYKIYSPQLYYGLNGLDFLNREGVIKRIVADSLVNPVDATVTFLPNQKEVFAFTKERSGKGINEGELRAKIEYALLSGKREIFVKSEPIDALITINELKKQTNLRARFSTLYPYSSPERKNNIALAVSLINGCVIENGSVFSFNEVVGIRSEERGFLPAKVILEGQFADGVGGGVCQVSTTLYNAALLAGLKIEECHRHSLRVDYVQPSFDAMVSDNFSDLKIKNDSGAPVYIQGESDGEKLTFSIYGLIPVYRYELLSSVLEVREAKSVVMQKITGEEKDVYPKNGLISEGYLLIYKGDELIEKRKIRSDEYKCLNGIFYVDKQ